MKAYVTLTKRGKARRLAWNALQQYALDVVSVGKKLSSGRPISRIL